MFTNKQTIWKQEYLRSRSRARPGERPRLPGVTRGSTRVGWWASSSSRLTVRLPHSSRLWIGFHTLQLVCPLAVNIQISSRHPLVIRAHEAKYPGVQQHSTVQYSTATQYRAVADISPTKPAWLVLYLVSVLRLTFVQGSHDIKWGSHETDYCGQFSGKVRPTSRKSTRGN